MPSSGYRITSTFSRLPSEPRARRPLIPEPRVIIPAILTFSSQGRGVITFWLLLASGNLQSDDDCSSRRHLLGSLELRSGARSDFKGYPKIARSCESSDGFQLEAEGKSLQRLFCHLRFTLLYFFYEKLTSSKFVIIKRKNDLPTVQLNIGIELASAAS